MSEQTETQTQTETETEKTTEVTETNKEVEYYKSKYESLLQENKELISIRDQQKKQNVSANKSALEEQLKVLQQERDEFASQLKSIEQEKVLNQKKDLFVKYAKKEGLLDNTDLDLIKLDFDIIDVEHEITAELLVRDLKTKMPVLFNRNNIPNAPNKLSASYGNLEAELQQAIENKDVKKYNEIKDLMNKV